VGYVVVMGRPMATSQDFVNWVCSDAIDNRYLKYVLVSEHESMLRFASGTTHQTIYYPEAKAFHVCLPTLPEQRAIADILGRLDDKIELNHRMNETLEATARAIFKSWFVDFDPVHAKASGRQPFGMDAQTAALFPSSFEDSALGKIPKGFQVAELGSVLEELETGSRPKGGIGGYAEGVPSIGAESIVGLAKFDFGKTKYVPPAFYSNMTRGKIKSRDVLLYKDGGRPGEYEPHVAMFGEGFPFDEACINEHVYRLQARRPLSQAYLYFWLTSDLTLDEMRQKGTGVAIPGLNSTAVRSLTTLSPPEEISRRYEGLCEPMVRAILNNASESYTLAKTRDALLPKLISGEIRIKDAKQMIGEKV
jgi:type I restriction enzyme S subunit